MSRSVVVDIIVYLLEKQKIRLAGPANKHSGKKRLCVGVCKYKEANANGQNNPL
jgi:hypothetical protein